MFLWFALYLLISSITGAFGSFQRPSSSRTPPKSHATIKSSGIGAARRISSDETIAILRALAVE
jgi:hypothetical protein